MKKEAWARQVSCANVRRFEYIGTRRGVGSAGVRAHSRARNLGLEEQPMMAQAAI